MDKDKIIEELNNLLCYLDDCGCLLEEDITRWEEIMTQKS